MNEGTASPQQLAHYWPLDPEITFLNHGSYGACPWPVLHAQSEWRARMEREPVRFLSGELEGHLDRARARLGEFLRADPDDLAFVPNATTGVNSVLRSLDFRAGDEILATDHEYNACLNAIRVTALRAGRPTSHRRSSIPPSTRRPIPPGRWTLSTICSSMSTRSRFRSTHSHTRRHPIRRVDACCASRPSCTTSPRTTTDWPRCSARFERRPIEPDPLAGEPPRAVLRDSSEPPVRS